MFTAAAIISLLFHPEGRKTRKGNAELALALQDASLNLLNAAVFTVPPDYANNASQTLPQTACTPLTHQ
jgi:hypothetical protein